MTTRQRWPVVAEQARMEAIAQSRRGLRAVSPLLSSKDTEVLRRIAIANDAFHQVLENLQAVGPGKNDTGHQMG